MAGADYKSCDVCSGKTFYDAHLNYEDGRDEWAKDRAPFREVGKEQYEDKALNQKSGLRLNYLGDWAVLCTNCAKTHKTQIVPIKGSKK